MLLSMTPSLTKGKPLGSRPWHQDVATDNDGLSGPSLVRLVVLVATDNDGLSGPSLVRLVVLVAGPVRGLLGSRPWLQDEVVRVWIWSFSLRFCSHPRRSKFFLNLVDFSVGRTFAVAVVDHCGAYL